MPKLGLVYKKTAQLVPYANNARTHDEAQIAQIMRSIEEFGFTNPILIDEDGGIIAGHGRIMAADNLGIKEVPTITLAHLSPDQRRAYVIADNKLALNAGWNEDILKSEINALAEAGFDLELTGFSADEIGELLAGVLDLEPLTEDDDTPDLVETPITKPGDVWIMGRHRLLCGDATDIAALEKLTNGQKVDLLLTDPPYNVAYEGKTAEALTIANDSMSNEKFRQFLRDAFVAADTVMRPGAVFYIWHADSEGYNFRGACFDTGWQVRQCLIWKKQTLVMGRQDYHWIHEPCLYGWKEGAAHTWASDRRQTTVLEFDRPSRNAEHPTMKPVALFEYQLQNNTKKGDSVLDLFAGSGTTAIAAEKHGRCAFLMELDPRYCDVIVRRWQEYTGEVAVLEGSGIAFDEAGPVN